MWVLEDLCVLGKIGFKTKSTHVALSVDGRLSEAYSLLLYSVWAVSLFCGNLLTFCFSSEYICNFNIAFLGIFLVHLTK